MYASVSGASWLDGILRVFAGGSAPVAAKVAVLGAGAAVVGSTAVVVPNVLDNHRPSHTTRRTPAVVQQSKALPTRVLVERVHTTRAQAHLTPVPIVSVSNEHEARQDGSGHHAQGSDDGSAHAAKAEASNAHGFSGSGREGDSQNGDGSGDGGSRPAISPLPTFSSEPSDDGVGD